MLVIIIAAFTKVNVLSQIELMEINQGQDFIRVLFLSLLGFDLFAHVHVVSSLGL